MKYLTEQGKRSKNPPPSDQTCLLANPTCDCKTEKVNTVGFRDKFGRFRNVPDPPTFRSVSMVGCMFDQTLKERNKLSLLAVWKNLQPNCNIPARNVKELSTWILNCAASPNANVEYQKVEIQKSRTNKVSDATYISDVVFKIYMGQ